MLLCFQTENNIQHEYKWCMQCTNKVTFVRFDNDDKYLENKCKKNEWMNEWMINEWMNDNKYSYKSQIM